MQNITKIFTWKTQLEKIYETVVHLKTFIINK